MWRSEEYHERMTQELGMVDKVKSPENQPQFSQLMMDQYWLGITKPKQAFRSTRQKIGTKF